MLSHFQKYF